MMFEIRLTALSVFHSCLAFGLCLLLVARVSSGLISKKNAFSKVQSLKFKVSAIVYYEDLDSDLIP